MKANISTSALEFDSEKFNGLIQRLRDYNSKKYTHVAMHTRTYEKIKDYVDSLSVEIIVSDYIEKSQVILLEDGFVKTDKKE